MELYIFFKKGNNSFFINRFFGTNEEIEKSLRDDHFLSLHGVYKVFKEGKFNKIMDEYSGSGCYYFITDTEKAEQHIKDIEWIKKVKSHAVLYPFSSMHIIELYRNKKENNIKQVEKLLRIIRKKHPSYEIVEQF